MGSKATAILIWLYIAALLLWPSSWAFELHQLHERARIAKDGTPVVWNGLKYESAAAAHLAATVSEIPYLLRWVEDLSLMSAVSGISISFGIAGAVISLVHNILRGRKGEKHFVFLPVLGGAMGFLTGLIEMFLIQRVMAFEAPTQLAAIIVLAFSTGISCESAYERCAKHEDHSDLSAKGVSVSVPDPQKPSDDHEDAVQKNGKARREAPRKPGSSTTDKDTQH